MTLVTNTGTFSCRETIVSVHVNDFGADPSGVKDSTSAVLSAIESICGLSNSAYTKTNTRYMKVIFGEGSYLLGDVPLISGCTFEGQGQFATKIIPLAGAKYCFDTIGTTTAQNANSIRMYAARVKDLSIGTTIQGSTSIAIPSGVGGIRVAYASYVTLENILFRSLDGIGLCLEEVWDSDFVNIRIMSCGNTETENAYVPGLYIGPGVNTADGSNALRFRGLHIEDCPQLLQIDSRSRHIFFTSPKLEGTTTSATNTIVGTQGVCFDNAELTWQYSTMPMFTLSSSNVNAGLSFTSPSMISASGTPGWYFRQDTNTVGELTINNPYMSNVACLFTGSSLQLKGGSAFSSGPTLIKSTGMSWIEGLITKSNRLATIGDGTDDFIILSGSLNYVRGCYFGSNSSTAGTGTPAIVNIASGSIRTEVTDNHFYGLVTYGVRQLSVLSGVRVFDNSTSGGVSSAVKGSGIKTSLNTQGTGYTASAMVNQVSTTLAASGTASWNMAYGGTTLTVYFISSTAGVSGSALLFLDGASTTITVLSSIGSDKQRIYTGTGTAGDGYIYVTKTGNSVTVTNNLSSSADVYLIAQCVSPI